jgi:hypothetical protein
MTSAETVTVYTVPSKFVAPYPFPGWRYANDPEFKTYQRVVGVKPPRSKTIWTPSKLEKDFHSRYKQSETEQRQLPLDPLLASRLAEFFQRYLSKNATETVYNCHSFGFWMEDIRTDDAHQTDELADTAVRNGKIKYDTEFEAGQHVLIGETSGYGIRGPEAYHSVVGLGPDQLECLQVVSESGHLGIMGWQEIAYRYPDDNLGLFETVPR